MDTNLIEPFFERTEQYGRTGIELLKLKSVDKTADLVSSLASRSILTLAISLFAIMLNIAIALWLGDLLGKYYYGFLIVASCHAIAAIVLLAIHPFIKSKMNDSIIRKLLS